MMNFRAPRRRSSGRSDRLAWVAALLWALGCAQPASTASGAAAVKNDATKATLGAPERITDQMLAGWPVLFREDWSKGLRLFGKDPGGRWSRTMVNDTKWHKNHGEQQVYTYPGQNGQTFNPFSIVKNSGKNWLRITARVTPPNELRAAWHQPFQSGVLTNYRSLGFTYGYFEARVILPNVHGAWPAFWTLPNDRKWPPEIDVFESLNHENGKEGGITKVHVNTHWWSKPAKGHAGKGGYVDLPNGGKITDPHVYGVLWTKEFVAHYIDRQRVMVVPNPQDEEGVRQGLHKPMHLIFSLAMGGKWPGPVDESKLPAHMDITDVSVWGLPNKQ